LQIPLKEGIGGETRPKERVKTDKVTIDNSNVCMYVQQQQQQQQKLQRKIVSIFVVEL
jgi:hypothetical protein